MNRKISVDRILSIEKHAGSGKRKEDQKFDVIFGNKANLSLAWTNEFLSQKKLANKQTNSKQIKERKAVNREGGSPEALFPRSY